MEEQKEQKKQKRILIVDGHSVAHRALHAMKIPLNAPDGTPTGVIVGFLNMLFKVEDEFLPFCKVVIFDSGGKTFRHELYPEYKSDRKPLDNDFLIQLPILQELLRFLGYNVIIEKGVEADDVAACAVKLFRDSGNEVILLSSDKDLFQVLREGIKMLRPIKSGVTGADVYDEDSFRKEFGFSPSLMPDYLALTGDKVDHIPGVQGIGEITAKKLLSQFNSIEEIFNSIEQITGSVKKKLESEGLEKILKTRDLTKLKTDVLDKNFIHECFNFKPDISKATDLALKLGLSRLLKRINPDKSISVYNITNKNSEIKIKFPKEKIIIDDYKSLLYKNINDENLKNISDIWDFKTAYYLIHPDTAGKKFPEIISEIKQNKNPGDSLLKISSQIESEIEKHDMLHDVMTKIDVPLIPVLVEMEKHGVRIDIEKFLKIQNELETRILEIEFEIIRLTGVRINVNSSQQVSWLLFNRLQFTPEGKTKGKTSFSTEASVLERLAKKPDGKIPALILEHRELSKMLTGFVIPLQKAADKNGIIHTTFEAAFTGTGRLSSRDPNLQNIPAFGHWAEEIKKGLIPVEPGNIFVAADYSQIELRVLAFLSNEEKLIEAFEKGRDIHTETASWVFGFAPEFVTPELRRMAKMINFGLLYGMSSFGLSGRLNISRTEASDIVEKYFAALPGVKNFLNSIVEDAKSKGFTRTVAGRIRPVKEIPARGQALDRALINTPIQGTAADIARIAMINFAMKKHGELFLQVHDSLVCECKENEVDEIGEILKDVMKKSGGGKMTLEVELKHGKSLASV